MWHWHVDIISECLINSVDLSVETIISFFVKQGSHLLNRFEYEGAFLSISQDKRKSLLVTSDLFVVTSRFLCDVRTAVAFGHIGRPPKASILGIFYSS